MPDQVGTSQVIRFATFEVDLQAQELRKAGLRLKLSGQPFQVLAILLEQPGVVVTREELQKRLWPDTFVDVDHNLNTAINKIREALGDSSENPRFVETLPRRGYRFIAPVDGAVMDQIPARTRRTRRCRSDGGGVWACACRNSVRRITCLHGAGFLVYKRRKAPASPKQRTLTRVTFDDGLQIGATWSPDGRFLAYSSDRGGKFDIWVQQVSGGDPVQITKGPGTQLAARLVTRRKVHCVSLRGGRGRLVRCARFGRRRIRTEDLLLSDITLVGPRTARRSCSGHLLRG